MDSNEQGIENSNQNNQNHIYYKPTLSEIDFPIVTSGLAYDVHDSTLFSQDEFRHIREAGFNVGIVTGMGASVMENNLKNALAEGMALIIFNKNFITYENNVKNKHIEFSAFTGVRFADEPSYKKLIGEISFGENEKQSFEYYYNFIINQGANILVFINLIGTPEADFMEGISVTSKKNAHYQSPVSEEDDKNYKDTGYSLYQWKQYQIYLDAYQSHFKPSLFSYDLYPIKEKNHLLYIGVNNNFHLNGFNDGELNNNSALFYHLLKIYSGYSKSHQRPFWAYCLSRSYMHLEKIHFAPVALEQYLRYEAFSALAYGAQGINYWAYSSHPNEEKVDPTTGKKIPHEAYFTSLTDRRGDKTATWYFARNVNSEIDRYKDIFLDAQITVYPPDKLSNYNVEPISENISFFVDGDGFVRSDIYNNGKKYIMIVNVSPFYYQTLKINIAFGKIMELTPLKSGGPIDIELNVGSHSRILIPGGYRIFQVI